MLEIDEKCSYSDACSCLTVNHFERGKPSRTIHKRQPFKTSVQRPRSQQQEKWIFKGKTTAYAAGQARPDRRPCGLGLRNVFPMAIGVVNRSNHHRNHPEAGVELFFLRLIEPLTGVPLASLTLNHASSLKISDNDRSVGVVGVNDGTEVNAVR